MLHHTTEDRYRAIFFRRSFIEDSNPKGSMMKNKLYLLLPVIAGTCWGTQGVFVRILANAGFDNLTIIISRISVSILIVFTIILLTDRSKFHVKPHDLPVLFSIGIMGVLFLAFAYNEAVIRTSLSLAAVLLCLAPVFVLLLSAMIFGEKITRLKVFCMLTAVFGCILLSGLLDDGGNLRWDTIGFFFGLGSAVANAGYTLTSKLATKKNYSVITIYFYSFILVFAVLAPFADWKMIVGFLIASPMKGSALYLSHSLWTSLLPALVYTLAVKNAEAGKVAIISSGTEPISSMLAGIILYYEIPSLLGIAGMILAIVSLIVLIRSK